MFSNTDKEWEKFGSTEPYFGVYSNEKFCQKNLTNENKEEFFFSGYQHIKFVLEKVREHVYDDFVPRRSIDFGCGVGRLTIPLAEVSENVVGIDVSESMLCEAKTNCEAKGITNIDFLNFHDFSRLNNKYNFIHSFIVFQHIPVQKGENIFENLLNLLDEGGVGVMHFTYANSLIGTEKVVFAAKKIIPFAENFSNLVNGRSFFTPQMQINFYNLNKLLFILHNKGVSDLYVEHTNHGGALGIILFFRKLENK